MATKFELILKPLWKLKTGSSVQHAALFNHLNVSPLYRKTAQIHHGPVDEQPGAVVHQSAVGRLQEFRQLHRSASVGAASVAP